MLDLERVPSFVPGLPRPGWPTRYAAEYAAVMLLAEAEADVRLPEPAASLGRRLDRRVLDWQPDDRGSASRAVRQLRHVALVRDQRMRRRVTAACVLEWLALEEGVALPFSPEELALVLLGSVERGER